MALVNGNVYSFVSKSCSESQEGAKLQPLLLTTQHMPP